MPPVNLLLKPASDLCGLRCSYCFYHDLSRQGDIPSCLMREDTLEAAVAKAMDYAQGSCTFAFQGGEPTLAGLPFFERVISLQQQYARPGLAVHNAIQTNGMHLDCRWAEFFARNRFLVGLSLDGTKGLHDRFRKTASGEGSFERVLQSARLLEEALVPYNILTVVTSPLASRIQSVYRFYRSQGFDYLQFIPCLDGMTGKRGPWSLKPGEYGRFLCMLFDLWYRDFLDGKYVNIRYFENLVGILLGRPPEDCGMCGKCTKQLVVEADGSVYPCDFFVLPQYRMGNIRTDSMRNLLKNEHGCRFVTESLTNRPHCEGCRWYALCRGGCRRDFTVGSAGSENRFCRDYQQFFEHAYPKLVALVRCLKL